MPEPQEQQITLVDGVGRPKVHTLPDCTLLPNVIRWPHPQRGEGEAQVMVHFDRMNGEFDAYGRQIYRQRCTGLPVLRDVYLIKENR